LACVADENVIAHFASYMWTATESPASAVRQKRGDVQSPKGPLDLVM
jgi:hypothetical protein